MTKAVCIVHPGESEKWLYRKSMSALLTPQENNYSSACCSSACCLLVMSFSSLVHIIVRLPEWRRGIVEYLMTLLHIWGIPSTGVCQGALVLSLLWLRNSAHFRDPVVALMGPQQLLSVSNEVSWYPGQLSALYDGFWQDTKSCARTKAPSYAGR